MSFLGQLVKRVDEVRFWKCTHRSQFTSCFLQNSQTSLNLPSLNSAVEFILRPILSTLRLKVSHKLFMPFENSRVCTWSNWYHRNIVEYAFRDWALLWCQLMDNFCGGFWSAYHLRDDFNILLSLSNAGNSTSYSSNIGTLRSFDCSLEILWQNRRSHGRQRGIWCVWALKGNTIEVDNCCKVSSFALTRWKYVAHHRDFNSGSVSVNQSQSQYFKKKFEGLPY